MRRQNFKKFILLSLIPLIISGLCACGGSTALKTLKIYEGPDLPKSEYARIYIGSCRHLGEGATEPIISIDNRAVDQSFSHFLVSPGEHFINITTKETYPSPGGEGVFNKNGKPFTCEINFIANPGFTYSINYSIKDHGLQKVSKAMGESKSGFIAMQEELGKYSFRSWIIETYHAKEKSNYKATIYGCKKTNI